MEEDLTLLRLQYEILNVPLESIAAQVGCPVSIIEQQAEKGHWQQIWPEPDLVVIRKDIKESDEDQLTTESEILLERSKRRLAIYNVAKEIHLSQKYLKLESELIDKASKVVTSCNDTKDIRALAAVFKDLSSKTFSGALASLSFGQDEGGLPTVVVRDLSGKG